MTSFVDREHAIETYSALAALARFNERARRHKALLSQILARAGLRGAEARTVTAKLLGLCATECQDREFSRAVAAELAERGIVVSPEMLSEAAETTRLSSPPTDAERSWVEYVAEQLFLLFSGPQTANASAGKLPASH